VPTNRSKAYPAKQVTVIFGPRRAGKTTLLQSYLGQTRLKYKLDSGDNIRTQQILSSQDFAQILAYVEGLRTNSPSMRLRISPTSAWIEDPGGPGAGIR